MKSTFKNALLATALLASLAACEKVPVGEVGIKVSNMGSDKGVNDTVLGTGYYWVGFTNSLYTFPTFMQNYVWTRSPHEGSSHDESITFQTADGLSVNADVGIAFQVEADKVPVLFQTYRKGLDEIRDIYLRNIVRDAIVTAASTRPIESVYGAGKTELLAQAQKEVIAKVEPLGIKIDQLSWVGDIRLPDAVVASIGAKIAATQKAQQIENEVASAKAEAAKTVATAQGNADSILLTAKAQAQANEILSQSLTDKLIQAKAIEKWNGVLSQVTGSGGQSLINLGTLNK